MDDLFMVLIIAGIVGFFYFRKKDKKKRNISIIAAIVSFVLFGIFSPDVDSEEAEQPKEEQVTDSKDTEKAEKEKEEEEKKKEQEKKEKEEEEAKKQAEKEEAEKKQAEAEQEEKKEQEAAELAETEFNPDDYNKELTFDDLARNPEENFFKKITFQGKIIQVIQDDDASQFRIATSDDYDKIMLIEIDNSKLNTRILEDDYIRFYGTYMGEMSYESTLGGKITVPAVLVDEFDFL